MTPLDRYRQQKTAWALIFGLAVTVIVFVVIWIDVGEINTDVIYSLLAFVVSTAAMALWTFRKANQSWHGVVVGEESRRNVPFMVFRTDSGRIRRIRSHGEMWLYFAPGDRVQKIEGFDYPEKEKRDSYQRICIVCGTIYPADDAHCPHCRAPAWNVWASP